MAKICLAIVKPRILKVNQKKKKKTVLQSTHFSNIPKSATVCKKSFFHENDEAKYCSTYQQ